ncbi:MAG: SAM-dependent methyltransferase, partial [Muribaculaceae bacterium]|nr:SAM-dependent methyltransferase [Muribaculaceae bacterium]
MKRQVFNQHIENASFDRLFISEMGWDNPVSPTKLPPVEIDGIVYQSKVVAEKSGYRVLVCEVDHVPTTSICRRIDIKTRNYANDYLLVFVERDAFHHLWLAPVRKVDKRDIVTIEYTSLDQAEFLLQKVDKLAFGPAERTTIVDVRERVQESFIVNSEKITKDFYAGFKKEHKAFVEFIEGITGIDDVKCQRDKEWFASVMLNRLMFCYFIQKKGFLDGNVNYLDDKLAYLKREQGSGHFFKSFYVGFLRHLFHDGLNAPNHNDEFEHAYGRIPYLNGGMLADHQIEREYENLD